MTPQAPQLFRSVPTVRHVPPQHTWPAPQAALLPHWQVPFTHWLATWGLQVTPQAPQFFVSELSDLQVPLQHT